MRHNVRSPPGRYHNVVIFFQVIPVSKVHDNLSLKTGEKSVVVGETKRRDQQLNVTTEVLRRRKQLAKE